jgi:hypothetical protein
VSLAAWLDAGYQLVISDCDATMRQLLDALFDASSDDELEQRWAAVSSESNYRREQAAKHEREQRRRTGGPTHARLVADDALDAAVAEWEQLTADTEPSDDAVRG